MTVLKEERSIGDFEMLPRCLSLISRPNKTLPPQRGFTKRRRTVPIFLSVLALLIASCEKEPSSASDRPSALPPTLGLVAYYPFNGDATDQSGTGNNGTVNGAIPTEDRFGRAQRAFAFDGVGSSISIPHSTAFNMGNNYSISLWFRLSDVSIRRALAAKNKTQLGINDYLNLSVSQTTGLLIASVGNGSEEVTASSITRVNDNLWHHTVVMVGSTLQLWIDGRLSNQVTQPIEAKQNADSLIVGSWQGSALFKGSIDDIRIYNRRLKFSEITALYNEE